MALAASLRADRAALVADVASGAVPPGGVSADPRSLHVKAVVIAEAVPGVGKVRARRLLEALGIVDHTRWGDLAPATADRVARALAEVTDHGASRAAGP